MRQSAESSHQCLFCDTCLLNVKVASGDTTKSASPLTALPAVRMPGVGIGMAMQRKRKQEADQTLLTNFSAAVPDCDKQQQMSLSAPHSSELDGITTPETDITACDNPFAGALLQSGLVQQP